MSKKMKLDLEDLNVQSFVTSLQDNEQQKVKGGIPLTCNTCDDDCSVTYIWACPTDRNWPTCYTCGPCCQNENVKTLKSKNMKTI